MPPILGRRDLAIIMSWFWGLLGHLKGLDKDRKEMVVYLYLILKNTRVGDFTVVTVRHSL